jgi:hypothetical protein
MMNKKDSVFIWTWGVFVLSLVLFAFTESDVFLVLVVAAFMLRPTLASVGLLKKSVDERELSINFRSGNVAFFVMLLACVFMAAVLRAEKNHAYEMFYMVIAVGLVSKGLIYILMSKNFRETAPKIMITAGILIACFSGTGAFDQGVLSLNFIMNILPGIVIIATGIVSRFYPKAGSIAILIITLYLSYFILRRGVNWSSAGTALLVLAPLLAASFGLWRVIEEKEV